MSENGSDHPIGYGRPPRATQFKPGQSGNRKGRPREAKNRRTILREELETKVEITENGKLKRISKERIAARQLANKAAGGDLKAIALSEAMSREHEAAAENASSVGPGVFDRPADAQTMTSIVERMKLSILGSFAAERAGHTSTATTEKPAAQAQDDAAESDARETGADVPNPKSDPEGDASC